jgi:general secretion pathway protein B
VSLILDALRKAEAERQRGAVPGLHSLAASAASAAPAATPAGRGGALAAGLAVVVLAAAGLWLWLGPGGGQTPAATAAPPAAVVASPSAAVATPPALAPPTLPLVVSAPPAARGPEPTAPAPTAAAPAPGPVVAPVAPPRPATAPILTQVRRLAELPPEQRRELPPLGVSGWVWSEQASARFVVIDGQVLREGDAAAPGLVLVKLAPRSATLRWRDTLIEVPF